MTWTYSPEPWTVRPADAPTGTGGPGRTRGSRARTGTRDTRRSAHLHLPPRPRQESRRGTHPTLAGAPRLEDRTGGTGASCGPWRTTVPESVPGEGKITCTVPTPLTTVLQTVISTHSPSRRGERGGDVTLTHFVGESDFGGWGWSLCDPWQSQSRKGERYVTFRAG